MEELTRRTVLALAMPGALLAVAGCGETATSATGGDINPAGLEFVTEAYNIVTFDREECSLAPTYAHTPAVKEIAAKLLEGANLFAAKLDRIMKAWGINPPTELRSDLRVRLYHIRLNHGLDFDRSFLWDQIFSHREALHRLEMLLSTPGQNPQLVALVKDRDERLRQNLAALRAIQRQLPPPPAPTGPLSLGESAISAN
jgi:predicted outer membrane protein